MRDTFGKTTRIPTPGSAVASSSLMMTKTEKGDPEKDIATGMVVVPDYDDCEEPQLAGVEQETLEELYKSIGNAQVAYSRLTHAPSWVVEKFVMNGLHNNWEGAYVEKEDIDVPSNQDQGRGERRRKLVALHFPHGNRDIEKYKLRKEASVASFDIICLLLRLSTILLFSIGCVDIKGAFCRAVHSRGASSSGL